MLRKDVPYNIEEIKRAQSIAEFEVKSIMLMTLPSIEPLWQLIYFFFHAFLSQNMFRMRLSLQFMVLLITWIITGRLHAFHL